MKESLDIKSKRELYEKEIQIKIRGTKYNG